MGGRPLWRDHLDTDGGVTCKKKNALTTAHLSVFVLRQDVNRRGLKRNYLSPTRRATGNAYWSFRESTLTGSLYSPKRAVVFGMEDDSERMMAPSPGGNQLRWLPQIFSSVLRGGARIRWAGGQCLVRPRRRRRFAACHVRTSPKRHRFSQMNR